MSISNGHVDLNVSRGIRCAAARAGDKIALRCDGAEIGYRDLVRRINKSANFAASLGLKSGDIVALLAPNCLEYVEIVAGLSDQGVCVATLNPHLAAAELDVIFDDCRPRLIIAHPSTRHLISDERARSVRVIVLGPEWEAILGQASDRFTLPTVSEQDSFSISYTSGTTGRPKGVMLTHRGRALAFLIMQAEYGCFGYRDHFLSLSPQYHGAGFAFCLAPLSFGGTCTLIGRYDAEEVLGRLGQGDIDGVFMVPTHFHRMFDLSPAVLDRWRGTHRMRTIISNAAALPQATKEQVIDYFGEGLLSESYGSTESGFVLTIRPEDHLRKPNSVGMPFVDMQVELRGEDGQPVPDGTPGELFARGPMTFNGYLNRPEETAEALRPDGWVTVGDMAVRDEDGFHYIVDRKKDMVVSGGINVYPREIENVVARVPGVSEVAIVGEPDAEWGERLHAFIVAVPGATPSPDAIVAACRSELAGFKIPRAISFIDELPRNASGKIMKRDLRQRAIDQAAG
jgi:acyl-CoA synthetase (AMP-forming)/AMP-acid ligase II